MEGPDAANYETTENRKALTLENVLSYLGKIESILCVMFKNYADLVIEKLKQVKDFDPQEDPCFTALSNITTLVNKPKMESIKELVNDVLNNRGEEEDQLNDDDRPLTMEDFNKLFQV